MKKLIPTLLTLTLLTLAGNTFAALSDYFVSTEWLASNRDQVLIVDVRKGPLYLLGHIDGAQHVGRDDFLETRNQVKSLVPGSAKIVDLLNRLGASQETVLVVYAEDDNPYAARLVWSLHYHGHTRAYVLDGGYDKWIMENRPISLLPGASPQPGHYVLTSAVKYLEARAGADQLLTRLENPGVVIWDTRSSEEYSGTDVRADRGGHIPGAVHLNWTSLLKEVDGVKVLKNPEEIVALLETRGVTPDKEILAHCQTGIRSSYATLVLLGLGYERARNYDGSWIEWANNPTFPIINAQGKFEGTSVYLSMERIRQWETGTLQEVTQ